MVLGWTWWPRLTPVAADRFCVRARLAPPFEPESLREREAGDGLVEAIVEGWRATSAATGAPAALRGRAVSARMGGPSRACRDPIQEGEGGRAPRASSPPPRRHGPLRQPAFVRSLR